jgi:hypothetical protein
MVISSTWETSLSGPATAGGGVVIGDGGADGDVVEGRGEAGVRGVVD